MSCDSIKKFDDNDDDCSRAVNWLLIWVFGPSSFYENWHSKVSITVEAASCRKVSRMLGNREESAMSKNKHMQNITKLSL